jgi:hypothetical protein
MLCTMYSNFSHPRGKTYHILLKWKLFYPCPPTRARTWDPLLKRQLLYQLSYGWNTLEQYKVTTKWGIIQWAIFDLQRLCQKISKSVSFMKFLTNVFTFKFVHNKNSFALCPGRGSFPTGTVQLSCGTRLRFVPHTQAFRSPPQIVRMHNFPISIASLCARGGDRTHISCETRF